MKKILVTIIILLLAGCSTVKCVIIKKETTTVKGKTTKTIIKESETNYNKSGWPEAWSPKDIDFEVHGI